MNGLPLPPPAYWTQIPWWAYLGLVLLVALIYSPFLVGLFRGKITSQITREQQLVNRAQVLDLAQVQMIAELRHAETAMREELARERVGWAKEREALMINRDEGWDLARGMEDLAHNYRHEHRNLVMRFNAALSILNGVVKGTFLRERAIELLAQTPEAAEMPPVPPLHLVKGKKP